MLPVRHNFRIFPLQVVLDPHYSEQVTGQPARYHDETIDHGRLDLQKLSSALRTQYMRPVWLRGGIHGNDEDEGVAEDQYEDVDGARA